MMDDPRWNAVCRVCGQLMRFKVYEGAEPKEHQMCGLSKRAEDAEAQNVTLRARVAELEAARETPALPAPASQPERPRPEPVLVLEPDVASKFCGAPTRSVTSFSPCYLPAGHDGPHRCEDQARCGMAPNQPCWWDRPGLALECATHWPAAAEPAPLEPPREPEETKK